jgi:hypothetical protein
LNIEIKKEELEKVIKDYVASKISETVQITGIKVKETSYHPRKIYYKDVEDISIELEI